VGPAYLCLLSSGRPCKSIGSHGCVASTSWSAVGVIWASPGRGDRYQRVTPEQNLGSARKRWLTFGIVWIIALVVDALGWRQENASNTGLIPLLILPISIALIPAFIFSSAFSRFTSLRDYLSTLVHPRGHFVWYLVALLTFPVVSLLGIVITNLLDSKPPLFNVHFAPGILSATLITFASVFFYSGG
jgi:hypothetical protein